MTETLTRKMWLTIHAMRAGGGPFLAVEAVATTALEHPEWDMDERHTWAEWEQLSKESSW